MALIHGINIFSQSFLNSHLTRWLPAGSVGPGSCLLFPGAEEFVPGCSGGAGVGQAMGTRPGVAPRLLGWEGGQQGTGSKTGQEEKVTKSLTGGISSCFRVFTALQGCSCCHELNAALGEQGRLPRLGVQPDPQQLEGSGQCPWSEQGAGRCVALCRTQHLCCSFPSCKTGAKIQKHVTSPAVMKGLGLSLPLPIEVIWLEGRAPGPGCGGERKDLRSVPGAGLWVHPGVHLTVGRRQRGGGLRVPAGPIGRRV